MCLPFQCLPQQSILEYRQWKNVGKKSWHGMIESRHLNQIYRYLSIEDKNFKTTRDRKEETVIMGLFCSVLTSWINLTHSSGWKDPLPWKNTTDPWTTWGIGVLTLQIVENLSVIYSQPFLSVAPPYLQILHICNSSSEDSTNCRLCSTILFTIEKNPLISGPA